MAKQLVVTVRAVDQMTPTMRRLVAESLRVGKSVMGIGTSIVRGLTGPIRMLTSFRGIMLTLGTGLIARRMLSSFNAATEMMDDLAKASLRLGIGVEQLSALRHEAELANVSFESLLGGFQTLGKNLGQFSATGGGRAADVIRMLGPNFVDAVRSGKGLADLLPEIADGINAIQSDSERLFAVQRLFGEGGTEWLSLLAEGGTRLRQFSEEARRLNAIITPEQAAIAEEYRDSITRVQSAWLGLRAKLVELVGPTLTDLMNRMAEIIAAVPQMVGNLMRTIRTSLGSGPEAGAAAVALTEMFMSWGTLAQAGVQSVGRLVLATAQSAVRVILGGVDSQLDAWFMDIGARAAHWASIAYNNLMLSLPQPEWSKGIYRDRIGAEEIELGILARERRALMKGLSQTGFNISMLRDFPELIAAVRQARIDIAAAGGDAFNATDRVLGIVEALSNTALPELAARIKSVGAVATETTSSWIDGFKVGWSEFLAKARDAEEQGRELALSVGGAISDGLSVALVDAIAGVKSLKEAMREWASQSLRLISEMTMRMVIFRAIAGIGGAFSLGPQQTYGMTPGAFGPDPSGFGMARGGIVEHFARGGFVPGPPVNRDVVPAWLTPGEYVMSRRAAHRVGYDALDRMNRGGGSSAHAPAQPVGPIIINVNGAGDPNETARAIKRILENWAQITNRAFANNHEQRRVWDNRGTR